MAVFTFLTPIPYRILERRFGVLLYINSWYFIQLGIHVDLQTPNVELHFPFGFLRVGWQGATTPTREGWKKMVRRHHKDQGEPPEVAEAFIAAHQHEYPAEGAV